ncbi:MAG: hypothetical protein R2705_07085 [Ilumatobacteraceae bacterium]
MGLNPIGNPDWPKQTVDLIENFTSQVREKATNKAVVAVRAVVFGLLLAFGAFISLILLLIVLTRSLQALIAWPFDHDTAVWISYLILGGVFLLGGMLAMRTRHSSSDS